MKVKQYSFISSLFLVETFIETMWKPIFKEKLHCSQQQLLLWLKKNRFFPHFQVEMYSFVNCSFWPVETNFMSSGNSILLFRALLSFYNLVIANISRETLLLYIETDFLANGSFFFIFKILLLVKVIFGLAETSFQRTFSFCMVDIDVVLLKPFSFI